MKQLSVWKGAGYLTSTLSVILLGVVSLKAASESAALMACLIGGALTSVLGMCLRWHSHRMAQREKAAERRARRPQATP